MAGVLVAPAQVGVQGPRKGGGEVEDIQAILEGRVVSWDAVSKFSTALGLDPSAAYPLWALAQADQPDPDGSTAPRAEDEDGR